MATPAEAERVVGSSKRRTRSPATAWLVLGILSFLGLSLFLLMMLAAREEKHKSRCRNNLKEMYVLFQMFVEKSPKGNYPQISPEAGKLMFSNGPYEGEVQVYPEYISDLSVLLCPSNPATVDLTDTKAAVDDHSYFYLGYIVTNEVELRAFADAYTARVQAGLPLDEDFEVPEGTGNNGGDVIYRLRTGAERIFMRYINSPATSAPAQAKIPIMWERCTLSSGLPHIPRGGNVLFMDGYVGYVRYGTWPFTAEALKIFTELDALSANVTLPYGRRE